MTKYLICDDTSDGHTAGDVIDLGPDTVTRLRSWGCALLPVSGDREYDHSALCTHGASRMSITSHVGIERVAMTHSLYSVPVGDYLIHLAARTLADETDIVPISLWIGSEVKISDWGSFSHVDGLDHCMINVQFDMPAPVTVVKFAVKTKQVARICWSAVSLERNR